MMKPIAPESWTGPTLNGLPIGATACGAGKAADGTDSDQGTGETVTDKNSRIVRLAKPEFKTSSALLQVVNVAHSSAR